MSPAEKMAEALHAIMRAADASKEPCGESPESPAAIRNGKFATLAQIAAQGLGLVNGPPLSTYGRQLEEQPGGEAQAQAAWVRELAHWHWSEATALLKAADTTALDKPEPVVSLLRRRAEWHEAQRDMLNALPAPPQPPQPVGEPNWRAVTESEPALNERVQFWSGGGWCYGVRESENRWLDYSNEDRDGTPEDVYGVEFWQPMPQAPKATPPESKT